MKPHTIILLCTLLLTTALNSHAESEVDITDRFTGHWGQNEQVTHNDDGTITFIAQTWGGLSYYVDSDWSAYSRLVFEFVLPPTVDVQPIVLYRSGGNESHYTRAGCTEAYIDLNPDKAQGVRQVALQTAANGTLHVRRIYLITNGSGEGDGDTGGGGDSGGGNEEQDARLVVNELMQSNIDLLMDDLNDFPDSWVELYNAGTTAAQLSRYSLGLTPDAGEAWPLPQATVKAGGHQLVYCDKVGKGLHADFRLESGKGGSVYLFRDGQLIDQLTDLRKQPAPNTAYGRRTDGSTDWGYQLQPSPGKANTGHVCEADHLLPQPLFSHKGRVVSDAQAFSLTLSMPEGCPQGTAIYFTVDGTEPTAASHRYTGPISINSTRVVRARAMCDGWLSSRSETQSYIFLTRQQTLPVVSIVTADKYLNDSRIGIFPNNSSERHNDWRRPINIEYFETDADSSCINQLCETRIAGAASRGAQMKSMAIYAHKRFGEKRFNHEFFPDQRPGLTDYKSLVLRNAGNDFDYLFMRDAIVQRTMALHADLDWQAWQPTIIYINGQYRGMLNLRERGNENNVYTNYNGLEDVDLVENWNDLKEGTWDNLNAFKAFYEEKGHTMAEYEQWMDCHEFINLMAMNLYFNNFDFPGNNIIMWRPRADGGLWRWIAKDCDYVMGLYGQGNANYKTLEWLYNPGYDGQHNWGANGSKATLLFRNLMEDSDFQREFIDHCAVYMGDFLNLQGISAVWDPMYELIKFEYPNHRKLINQWWPNYDSELSTARQWVSQRTAQFYQQLADFYHLGSPVAMSIVGSEADNQHAGITFNGVPLSRGLFDGKFFAGRDILLQGTPGDSLEVTGWHVQQVNSNGKTTTSDISGPMLSLTMPQCQRLIVTPILQAASGIGTVTAATVQAPAAVYSLSGQRLSAPRKGLNIIGGRKVMVK